MKIKFTKSTPNQILQELNIEQPFNDEPLEINDAPCYTDADDDINFSIDSIVPEEVTDKTVRDTQSILFSLIKDAQSAIENYNGVLTVIQEQNSPLHYLLDIGADKIIMSIVAEENNHLGQLQHLLDRIQPIDGANIQRGEQEAKIQLADAAEEGDMLHPFFSNAPAEEISSQMKMVDGIKKLPVQSFNYVDSRMNTDSNTSNECDGNDLCTVANVDDDF